MDIKKIGKLYKQNSLLAFSTEKFILWILEEISRVLERGKEAMKMKDIAEQNKQIQICQQLILEIVPLVNDFVEEGKSLIAIIDYINRRLIEANMSGQMFILEEIEDLLYELSSALKGIIEQK